jgi:dihydrofolate reductase
MRPLIVFSDLSLDGYMTGREGGLEFLVDDPVLEAESTTELRAVADTIIVGRKSFPGMSAYWTAAEGDVAHWMNTTPKHLLTDDESFDVSAWGNTVLATGDGVEHVRELKAGTGGALVVFGGTATVRSLVAADLVDQYWLKLNPVLTGGGGSPFTGLTEDRRLRLQSARPYPSGAVLLVYTT